MSQITHQTDDESGHLIQLVTPATLRRILDAEGSNYAKPDSFGPDDEWDTDSDNA